MKQILTKMDLFGEKNKKGSQLASNNINGDLFRYRSKQLNVTKVEQMVQFHSSVRKEYLMERSAKDRIAIISLQDYCYEAEPKVYEEILDAMKELEYIKEKVIFKFTDDNEIEDILNYEQLCDGWKKFKPYLKRTEYYKELEKVSRKGADEIIESGDTEFASIKRMIQIYKRGLFYHLLFNKFDVNTKQKLSFLSQAFINIPIELELNTIVVRENTNEILYRTEGILNKNILNKDELQRQYDQYYKPLIKYNFTEYSYRYIIRRTIDKATNVLKEGVVILTEEVKNNIQFITQYNLNLVDL
ncbi:hypothetical protein [Prevotella intermedia]|uniref:Uncharacterized protein n=2 Tax=Prevotella intermedia TaxID=28131 RepID=A0AAJ3VF26_PREIN|nr:hypothetical protein [Prevotella intermedia]AWX06970.1 hypothetical protein CTM55_04695 [Prevotella intermedia]PJI20173.1 hypothetical protein CTM53_04705 [Prevotella intermedia]